MAKKPAASAPKSAIKSPAVATAPAPATTPAPVAINLPATASIGADQSHSPPSPSAPVSYADIEKRAYELWTQGAPGGPADHWLQAERELRSH